MLVQQLWADVVVPSLLVSQMPERFQPECWFIYIPSSHLTSSLLELIQINNHSLRHNKIICVWEAFPENLLSTLAILCHLAGLASPHSPIQSKTSISLLAVLNVLWWEKERKQERNSFLSIRAGVIPSHIPPNLLPQMPNPVASLPYNQSCAVYYLSFATCINMW